MHPCVSPILEELLLNAERFSITEVFIMFDQGLQFDTHERWMTYLLSHSQLDATEKDEPSPNIYLFFNLCKMYQ